MKYRLEIQLEAIIDVKRAYNWYEDKRLGLGDEFIIEIEECYSKISEYPERYNFVPPSTYFRRIKLYRFPYIIVFEVSGMSVIVSRVAHVRQDKTYL